MFDIVTIVKTAGYLGIAAIVFTESGLLIGIVLPGDSLLFTAGILASQGYLNIALLALIAFVMAVLGDNVGYWLGNRYGRRIFSRKDSFFLNPNHIKKAESFYEEYGSKTVFLARFVPVVRTLAPVLAGIGSMRWKTFARYNFIGGLVWGAGMPLAGYWLGRVIPDVDRYLLPIIAVIIIVSILPGLWQVMKKS